MSKTGVFFHPEFSGEDWPIIGNKFANFPKAMEKQLALPNVVLIEPKPVSEELLLKVHTKELVERTKRQWYWRGAVLSVGGMVEALEMVYDGRLRNALVFDVAAGHHAGPSSAWGGTYLSLTGPAVVNLREKHRRDIRVAILDTDAHHGDGTRAVFRGDKNTLHVCFCYHSTVEEDGTKVCVGLGWAVGDQDYMERVKQEFIPRAREFKPEIIIHLLGHDTCIGDYGDRGLSPEFFPKLVEVVKQCAEEVCGGRYVVASHGGYRRDVAEYIFPKIIEVLASR